MIARLKAWALMALSVLTILAGAYAVGGRAARRSAEIDRARRARKVMEASHEVDKRINALDDDSVVRSLDKWVRNRKR